MKNKPLRVNEIFYSLQGEGYWTGTPMVFIRLAGCNLRCDFCDTDHSRFTPMTPRQITDKVMEFPPQHVVITGGEPSLQPLEELVDLLHEHGRTVHIETNGTNRLPLSIDWITCSPKDGGEVVLDRIDELKVVFQNRSVEHMLSQFPRVRNLFLQPVSGSNIPETVSLILEQPHWRLSLQTHKILDIQ